MYSSDAMSAMDKEMCNSRSNWLVQSAKMLYLMSERDKMIVGHSEHHMKKMLQSHHNSWV